VPVAVITDIHGNLPALEAALARIEELGIDEIYCGGDLVGYGPHPNEVCALIEARGIPTIYGNYDYAIGRDLADCGCAYVDQDDRELGQQSADWTLAHTNAESKARQPPRRHPLGPHRTPGPPVPHAPAADRGVRRRPGPEEIRACADAILDDDDDVPIRSFVMSLATRRTRDCLCADHCPALETAA
jgi:hypothetical protein